MLNHYQTLNSKYKNKSFNPNKGKTHNIDIPFRMCIIGGSGSGKTNCLMNLLKIAFNSTFSHIYLCIPNKDEPLYNQMIDKLGDSITVFEDGTIPKLKDLPKNEEQLIIFDDLVGNKGATPEIIEFFKMARKKNISCVYLSQSYFKIDKLIRQNTNYIIIKKIASKRDLIMLMDILHSHIYKNFNERLL